MLKKPLDSAGPHVTKEDTVMKKAVSPGHTMCNQPEMPAIFYYRVAYNSKSLMVPEAFEFHGCVHGWGLSMLEGTKPNRMQGSETSWGPWTASQNIAVRFPLNGCPLYYKFKDFHSIVFLPLENANYKFLYVDMAVPGSSDMDVFQTTTLQEALKNHTINSPEYEPLPKDTLIMLILMYETMHSPLKAWVVKPHP